jgi:tetratricopeptide (TPR) repeat protein
MQRLFFLLCSLSFFQAKAQFNTDVARHLDEVNNARLFMADNKIDSAVRHYETALRYFDDAKDIWYELGDLYVKKEGYTKAMNAYDNAILRGYFSSRDLHSADFKNDFSKPQLAPFMQHLDSLFAVYYINTYNWEFSLLVRELKGTDQFPRNMLNITDEKDTVQVKEYYKLMAIADTAYNLPRLLDYLDNHPFPKASGLNGDVSNYFWILTHHILSGYEDSANPKVAKLRKYIEEAVYNGIFDLKSYVTTLDYRHAGLYRKQLYGMYKTRNKENVYSYYPELDSIKSIDKRRAKWHLLPLYLEKKVNDWYPEAPEGYDPETQER